MKVSQLKVRVIEDTTAANLEAAVNAFLAAAGEATLIGAVQLAVYNTKYVAIINYTE